jgi:hypothetical protein
MSRSEPEPSEPVWERNFLELMPSELVTEPHCVTVPAETAYVNLAMSFNQLYITVHSTVYSNQHIVHYSQVYLHLSQFLAIKTKQDYCVIHKLY